MTKQKNTRRFSYDEPIAYQGSLFPSTQMDIEDDKGNVSSRNVFTDASGKYYTLDNNGNTIPIVLQNNLDEVTVTPTPRQATAEERISNQQKQAMMRAAGYNVPIDGSWGAYQEAIWHNLTTKPKEYDNTLMGLAEGIIDKFNGNNTERTNPLYQGEVGAYNPDNVDWGKTRRSQSKVINALSGTWGPIVAVATAPGLVSSFASAPIATAATLGGGYAGGWAANKASEALTGRDFGTNVSVHTPLTPGMGDMLNPGYIVGGGYGNFVGNNFANRERYILNYLTPTSYKGHKKEILGLLPKPLYETPPTFYRGKKPAWYSEYAKKEGIDAAEQRFQNGLVWAGIPEEEAAHPMYIQNADGSYRLTQEGFSPNLRNPSGAGLVPDEKATAADWFTVGKVGGEHSDYKELGDWMGVKLMQFKDRQQLNPQWLITHPIKKAVEKVTSKDNAVYKYLDWLGGKPLDSWMGYKPFTIKQNYIHTGNQVYPIYEDPANTSYVPNWIVGGN